MPNSSPIAGAFQGAMHIRTPFLTDGRSLHPLQRLGMVPHSGMAVYPASGVPGMHSNLYPAKASNLMFPNTLNTSIIAATRGGATHV
jgi:hypothetical protein